MVHFRGGSVVRDWVRLGFEIRFRVWVRFSVGYESCEQTIAGLTEDF